MNLKIFLTTLKRGIPALLASWVLFLNLAEAAESLELKMNDIDEPAMPDFVIDKEAVEAKFSNWKNDETRKYLGKLGPSVYIPPGREPILSFVITPSPDHWDKIDLYKGLLEGLSLLFEEGYPEIQVSLISPRPKFKSVDNPVVNFSVNKEKFEQGLLAQDPSLSKDKIRNGLIHDPLKIESFFNNVPSLEGKDETGTEE